MSVSEQFMDSNFRESLRMANWNRLIAARRSQPDEDILSMRNGMARSRRKENALMSSGGRFALTPVCKLASLAPFFFSDESFLARGVPVPAGSGRNTKSDQSRR
jgi:hypothetical protein